MAAYEIHDFYCIKCGNKSIPLSRKSGYQHARGHRKKLYCPHCKLTINHVEIRNYDEKEEFLEKFKNGEFITEVEESIENCESSSMRVLFESISCKR